MNANPRPPARERIFDALHVLTLASFAVAQPLFDILGRNASFFAAHRAQTREILVFTGVTVVAVPAIIIAIRAIVSAISPRTGDVLHLATIGVLFALVVVPPLARGLNLAWPFALGLAVIVAIGAARLYSRTRAVRRFLLWLSPAAIVFPLLFVFASPVRELLFQPARRTVGGPAKRATKTPVVFVLFDELALSNIVTPAGEINAARYPHLARFAARSTWYRQATTVALRTDQATPAMLTGRRTARREIPSSHVYPDNLFTLLSGSHTLSVSEFVTQLCPPDLCPNPDDPSAGLGAVLIDASIVYMHIVTPPGLAARVLPPLGDRWGGFAQGEAGQDEGGGARPDPVVSWLRSALGERRERHEGDILDAALRDLRPTRAKPAFSYIHLQIPHPPWRYLPTGQTYPTGSSTPGYRNFRWGPNQYLTDQVLQRSMLQTVYADELLGRLVRHLDKNRLMDDALVVVTSDHGATWDANGTRREIDRGRAPAMLGVPLFVKYPNQSQASVDDESAETIDIVPTIADVLGIDVPWDTHGSSLRTDERRRPKQIFDGKTIRPITVDFDGVRRRAHAVTRLFGTGGGRHDLYGFGPYRRFIGLRTRDLEATRQLRARVELDDEDAYRNVDPEARSVPALLRGRVLGLGSKRPLRVVASVNGTVAGAGETFVEDGTTQISMVLDPRSFRDGANRIEIFAVLEGNRFALLRGP